jgi:hypothetical protein
MTSGTLAYSHGLGRPVVSTPYWHALELLNDGSGALVPFGDTAAMGSVVSDLLTDEASRLAMGRRAYVASRAMTWRNTALCYREAFRAVCRKPMPESPRMPLDHFAAMCDDTGLFQHAVYGIPDRNHGYCIDDNARALLLCHGIGRIGIRTGTPASSQRCSPALPRLFSMGGIRTRAVPQFHGL